AVRMPDGGADIAEPAPACANAEASGIAPARERIAAHELEGEPGPTVGCHTAVDEAREVGMVEAGEDAALAQEAGLHVVEVEAAADQLDRDFLFEVGGVPQCAVDHAHAAVSDAFDDPE